MGKLDCLEHLTAKGANLKAQDRVRRGPAATWRRGVWGHPPPARSPATAHPRVWGRRRVSAVEEDGAAPRGYGRPRSLRRAAAQGGGRREPQERGERWRRGPKREAWVG
eukprot:scaffold76785_cov35-Phaeocystis_antarctica.AAC.2